MGSPPGRGRSRRAYAFRAALPCLLLTALETAPVVAQSLTPDLFNPTRGGFAAPDTLPTRRTAAVPQAPSDAEPDPNDDPRKRRETPAPSRIGQIPTYGLPAANGASSSGYDSLNRKRQQPKLYPGQPKPKRAAGPGSPLPPRDTGQKPGPAAHRAATVRDRAQGPSAGGDGRHGARSAVAPPPQGR